MEQPASGPTTFPLKALGLLAGWLVGAAVGWHAGQADLLESVLRGAAVWAAVTALWMGGVTACEWIFRTASRPEPETEAAPQAAEPESAR